MKKETVKIKSDAHPSGYKIVNTEDAPKSETKQSEKPVTKRKRSLSE